MDFDLKYKIDSNELEPSIAEKYVQAIKKCRESDDPFESIESLNYALESLEDSFAASGRGIEWYWEMIKAYRNLCRIYIKRVSSEDFENYLNFSTILDKYNLDNDFDLENVLRLLDKYNLDDASDLENVLGLLKNRELKDFPEYMEFVDVLSEHMEKYDASELKKILGVLQDYEIYDSSELEKMLESEEEDRDTQKRLDSSIRTL